jgi:hypothetical protein
VSVFFFFFSFVHLAIITITGLPREGGGLVEYAAPRAGECGCESRASLSDVRGRGAAARLLFFFSSPSFFCLLPRCLSAPKCGVPEDTVARVNLLLVRFVAFGRDCRRPGLLPEERMQ